MSSTEPTGHEAWHYVLYDGGHYVTTRRLVATKDIPLELILREAEELLDYTHLCTLIIGKEQWFRVGLESYRYLDEKGIIRYTNFVEFKDAIIEEVNNGSRD
jgi:hypothetical protein